MTLVLTIENEQSLPNGAPVSVRLTGKRSLDIGRSATIDWSLPDPTRFISGRHCEVRYRDDGYWLNDLSTNGTFLNDSARRIQAPCKLRHGDRLAIGSYVIAVAIEADDDESARVEPAGEPAIEPLEARLDASLGDGAAATGAALAPVEGADAALTAGAEATNDRAAARAAEAAAGAAPRAGAALARPQTKVRARGFTTPPTPGADPAASDPGPEALRAPACLAAREEPEPVAVSTLNPNEEARAWSAPAAAEPWSDRAAGRPGPPEPRGGAPEAEEFLRRFAKGAGIPEHVLARQDGLKLAEELGALMRMTVEDMTQLLNARFKAKRFARAASQTMIQALDNNPLKFAPTPSDALKIMFGPRTSGYLDARRAFEGAFTDLKTHQIATFAAMQQAVRMLVEDLDPQAIEGAAGADKGLAALFGGRKARLWDIYLARWQAKTLRHEDGLVDAYMLYFAQCYDQGRDSSKDSGNDSGKVPK